MEGMFALSRVISPQGPMHNYLMLNEIDRGRSPQQHLTPQTFHLLADKFQRFGDQYTLFAEFHQLNDLSISRYLAMADYLSSIPDRLERADALGMFQANIGLWQILARQGQIPEASMNDSWQHAVNAFGGVHTSPQIFEAGRIAFSAILTAAAGKAALSQDQVLALLAGPEQSTREGQLLRVEMAGRMRQVMDDQRLVSLDTLLTLGDGLTRMAKGEPASDSLLPLAAELREFAMPKPLFYQKRENRTCRWPLQQSPYHPPDAHGLGESHQRAIQPRGIARSARVAHSVFARHAGGIQLCLL